MDTITGVGEQLQRFFEAVGFGEDIVRVERGNHEDANPVLRKDGGDLRNDTDQGEIQDPLDPEGLPTVRPFNHIRRNESGRVDKGTLLIGRTGEDKRQVDVYL